MTLQKLRREQGQAVVLVALMVVVLVGSLALVVDVGNMYAERRFMQNAADAGAMAGARALALQQDPLPAVARYAQTLNGAAAFETKVLTSSVVVTATKTGQSFFAGVIGAPTYTVRAVAEAGISSPSSYDGPDLVPIAVHDRDFHTCNDSETTGWTLIWDSDTDLDAPKN
ncbi:MAG TPA: pilus assembly protein TadG-related protein, partial [Anaerolineae bacterium]|nr:pilus assembly protein TadG-related protein [Anaerolineae bacterium]